MAESGRTGRKNQGDQDMPEVLIDEQKAERAIKQAKNRGRHC